MISVNDIYEVLSAIVPLYVAMALAYSSYRWWRIFTAEHCSGINRFVSVFAVPLLSFKCISDNNPYAMNYRFIIADLLQKIGILASLFIVQVFVKNQCLEWTITNFSLATLPNTLVVGIPLLTAMYGSVSRSLMIQIVVLQGVIWYTLLLFLFEYRAAKILISEQFRDNAAASIVSIRAESDVISLARAESLRAETEIDDDGGIHVILKSVSTTEEIRQDSSSRFGCITPRLSDMSDVEIYSVQSFDRALAPRVSSFSKINTGRKLTPRPSNEDELQQFAAKSVPNLHMFPWHSEQSVGIPRTGSSIESIGSESVESVDSPGDGACSRAKVLREKEEDSVDRMGDGHSHGNRQKHSLATGVVLRLILVMVWRKLVRNPNTYGSLFGLAWSLVFFKAGWHMPAIVKGSISILADAGLGMAMFSIGLFMAMQPKILACGPRKALWSMVVRFLLGPVVMAGVSFIVGLRGNLLHIAIVQAALPQGIVPFVFAHEYNVHPYVLSTAVIFGIIVALPITIIYYILLEI